MFEEKREAVMAIEAAVSRPLRCKRETATTVVQQGMNGDKKQALRYHWHSENLKSFVDEPHCAIDGPVQGEIVNLTDKRAETSRAKQLDLLEDLGPDRIIGELAALTGETPAQALLRTSSCRRITTCGRATSSRGGCMARSQPRPSAVPPTFPICC
jgi:hypothetical protein